MSCRWASCSRRTRTATIECHALCGINGALDAEWTILAPRYESGVQKLYLHSSQGYSAASIVISNNTWYWVTIQYNRTAHYGYLAVYLASTMAQVGSTVSVALGGSAPAVSYWAVGQSAQGGNVDVANSWFGPTVFDWTDGTFPLLPSEPAAPPGHVAYEAFIGGPQATPVWPSPALLLTTAWDATLLRVAGSDRTITWSIRKVASGAVSEAFAGTQSVTTTEHSLPTDATYDGDAPQAGDGLYQVFLDLNALVGGDLFRFRIYEETA